MSIVTEGLDFVGHIVLQGYGATGSTAVPTLIVEDGSGKLDADSFCSVSFADDYFAKRYVVDWASLPYAQKEGALRRATDFIEQEYRMRWAGFKRTAEQSLSWPRWEVYYADVGYGFYGWAGLVGFDTVPELVKKACAELAVRASRGQLSLDVGRPKDRVRVGGLQGVDVTYSKSVINQNTFFTAIEAYLRPFLTAWSSPGEAHSVRLERS